MAADFAQHCGTDCVLFHEAIHGFQPPKELIEAARIDGSGEFHTFNVIILPILKPVVAVQAIFLCGIVEQLFHPGADYQ